MRFYQNDALLAARAPNIGVPASLETPTLRDSEMLYLLTLRPSFGAEIKFPKAKN